MNSLNWTAFALNWMWWLFGAVAAYVVIGKLFPLLSRRTHSELDDLIIGVVQSPTVIFVAAFGLVQSLSLLGLSAETISTIEHISRLVWIWLVTWVFLRFVSRSKQTFQEMAAQSESNFDDTLVPILSSVGPTVVILVALLASVAWGLGIDLGLFIGILGGLSFIIAFAFQDILGNLFAGAYLLVGNPFRFGDFIRLEDGGIFRVEDIGLRATELYDIDKHVVVFMPNSALASQKIANITKPNVEIKASIPVGVAYGSDPEQVENILVSVARAHPHILAPLPDKLNSFAKINEQGGSEIRTLLKMFESSFEKYRADVGEILNQLEDIPSQALDKEHWKYWVTLTRWINEHLIRLQVERLSRAFYALSAWVNHAEDKGWQDEEVKKFESRISALSNDISYLQQQMSLWMQLAHVDGWIYETDNAWLVDDPLKEIESMVARVKSGQVPSFASQPDKENEEFLASIAWMMEDQSLLSEPSTSFLERFPYATQLQDFQKLYQSNHRILWRIRQHLENWSDPKNWKRAGKEFSLDTEIDRVRKDYLEQLPMPTPKWKRPDTTFVDFGASSLDFRLDFFIDDIVGEHFGREDDVVTEIREEIVKQFAKEGIEIPFPQQDVWFHNEIKGNWNGQSKK